MKLSSSTDLLYKISGSNETYPIEKSMRLFHEAGFRHLDASLWVYADRGQPMAQDNWKEWVEQLRACADSYGIQFAQTHGKALSGMQWDDPDYPDWDFFFEMNRRCIEATRILGAPWMVLHPSNCSHDPFYDRKRSRDRNLSYLEPYIELAKKAGVGIAVENMVDLPWVERWRYAGRDPEDLVDLIDTVNDPDVGICVDTGHAHLSGVRPAEYIRLAGSRLKCTHIDDNKADKDTHLMPYHGTVDWQDTMNALREIGYEHALSLEISTLRIPRALGGAYADYAYQTLEQLTKI